MEQSSMLFQKDGKIIYSWTVKNRFTQIILYLHGFTGKRIPILAESQKTGLKRRFMGLHWLET